MERKKGRGENKKSPALCQKQLRDTCPWQTQVTPSLQHGDETQNRQTRETLMLLCCHSYATEAWNLVGYLWAGACFTPPTPPFPTPLLWSELVSRCEVEWLVSQLWSGCAWIKVVTEQQGGWQMPQTESFSIRLPFQVAAKVKHFTSRWKKSLAAPLSLTHTHTHVDSLILILLTCPSKRWRKRKGLMREKCPAFSALCLIIKVSTWKCISHAASLHFSLLKALPPHHCDNYSTLQIEILRCRVLFPSVFPCWQNKVGYNCCEVQTSYIQSGLLFQMLLTSFFFFSRGTAPV